MKSSRVNGDPVGSERGRSCSQRKAGREPGFTPTEKTTKARLMRQFQRMPEGYSGNSRAYVESAVWCRCGRMNGTHSHDDLEEKFGLKKFFDEVEAEARAQLRKVPRR